MPTLLEVAGIAGTVPDAHLLEGTSFLPLLRQPELRRTPELWKRAAFTEYPRCGKRGARMQGKSFTISDPSLETRSESELTWDPSDSCALQPRRSFTAMGRSIRTSEWRYTRWMRWNGTSLEADWSEDGLLGEELYWHGEGEPRSRPQTIGAPATMIVDAMAFRGAPGRSRNTYDIDATENENLAGRDSFRGVREEMAVALRRGWRSAAPADFPLSLPRPKKLKQKRRRRREASLRSNRREEA